MRSIVLYLHMHQPWRLKHYSIFSVDHDHDYWTEKDWYAGTNNERIFKKVADKSYRPMLARLEKCINTYAGFVAMMVPVIAYLCISDKKILKKIQGGGEG